ncbi:MAG: adenylosuccinate synthetase, partial [Fidelibacterota bacterium]
EPPIFREKLEKAYEFNQGIIEKVFRVRCDLSFDDMYRDYLTYGARLNEYVTDTELELYHAYKARKTFLFEGAQGMSLDVDHGLYPHTTSSTTTAGQIVAGSGVGYNGAQRIIGVAKAYVTRVGTSPFPTELHNDQARLIREVGREFGTTTGRPRRIGCLDLVQLRQAVRVNGLTDIALTKIDVLSGFRRLQVCTTYSLDGETATEMPASLQKMRRAEPRYTELSGWGQLDEASIEKCTREGYKSLPPEMKQYIEFVEEHIDCPITIISLGPERSQTILRSRP